MHISLRALEPEDIDFLYLSENNPMEWTFGPTNEYYSRDLLRQYILSTTGDIYTDKQLRLVICLGGVAVGLVDLTSFDPKNMRAEVGIMIAPEYRQRGIAKEALLQLKHYAHNIIHLHQLYAVIPTTNEASMRLFRDAMFEGETVLADWLYDGEKYYDARLMQFFFEKKH